MRMPRRIVHTLGLALGLVLVADLANAGLGDMLKNKVKALKSVSKAKPAENADTGALKSRMSPPVTAELLVKFKAAMELELAEREKTTKFLATLKTPEAWRDCEQKTMMSPEAQKIMARMGSMGEKATPEEARKVVAQMSEESQKLLLSKCGPDPAQFHRDQMIRDGIAKGSDAFLKDDNAYAIWKEWVAEFCNYIEQLEKEPDAKQKLAKIKDEGLRIPGTGTGIFYVYTASEANELLERCDELMPLIKATM